MKKEIFKSLIALHQAEMPFERIARDTELPLDRGKIITIPGVRRCGKSTMMELAINRLLQQGVAKERILWVGFDDERLRFMSVDELDEVVAAYMEMFPDMVIKDVYMFFDELQLIEGWEYFVLRLYKSYCKNIYVCGSNATMLSSELKSALRGYPLEIPTYPLSFHEYCRFKSIPTEALLEQDKARLKMAFQDYCMGSAFPEVVLTHAQSERTQLLHGYFNTMLLRDMAEHYGISNLQALRYFIKRVMANLTKPTSVNGIYSDIRSQGIKVSKDDPYRWMEYACGIFLFLRVSRFSRSFKRELTALDKYYCIDNGLRAAVLMPQSHDQGKNLENTVLLELRRRLQPFEKITYFQGGGECDFVVQREECVSQLIQVTWNMQEAETREREIRGLLEASRATGCTDLLIVTFDEEATLTQDGLTIRVLPAWKWCII